MSLIKQIHILILVIAAGSLFGQQAEVTQILAKMDSVTNAPMDQYMHSTMIIVDRDGNISERETIIYQKGAEKRLVRFLSPADQRGISFLSLPNDIMYLYLPAFRKIRMIASHVKNQNFAGTDFSYDDMSAFKFAEEYDPKLISDEGDTFVLELIPKKDIQKDYSKLKMWIVKNNYVSQKIEYYDKGGNLWKVMHRTKFVEQDNYWFPQEMEMKDLKKDHSTKMIIHENEFDSGLLDNVFTKRNLKKSR